MSISGIGSNTPAILQSLVEMRAQLEDLNRQLGTGKKAVTYAGVGINRGFAVGLHAQITTIGAFGDTIKNVSTRMDLAQTSLGRVIDITHNIRSTTFQSSVVRSDGSTVPQSTARDGLDEMLNILNARAGDRYLFSGLATDQPAVESYDHIMNGDGARAGFKQILTERRSADLGANGLGRLNVTAPTATSVALTEDAVSPFGLKLAGIVSTLTGAAVTGPSGSPATVSIDLPANPNAGDDVRFDFNLPDGSKESITLAAVASTTPGLNAFTIGPTAAATASNLQAALTTALDKFAHTTLTAASSVAAGNDFFGSPPQRVAGPPFDTATAQVAGTAADTVSWYTGESGPVPARATATVQVDATLTVSYGMRANEQGLRWLVQNMATLAAVTYSPTDPNAPAMTTALGTRVGNNLEVPTGIQRVQDIQADLAGGQSIAAAAMERHHQTETMLNDMLQGIEGVPTEQVGAQILALQTRLQASFQATSLLYHTSLVNFL
jgi:flagellar hook-associated protein 3 FlgL